jgi:hypothetical protein
MFRNYNKRYLLSGILSLLIFTTTWAQKSDQENNPYTRFGIGEFRNAVNVSLRGMGSVSSAYSNEYSINTDNPASYTSLKFTTYEAGVEGSKKTIYYGGNSYPTGTLTYSYLTIGIPVGKHFAMALGLRPMSRVYYNTVDSLDITGLGPSIRTYSGDGAVSHAYIGLAGKIKGLSVGVNVGYLFGTINHTSSLDKQYDSTNYFNSGFSNFIRIGDLYYKAGLLYENKLKKNLGIRIGATFSTKQNINARKDDYQYIYTVYSGETVVDTAIQNVGNKGTIVLPTSYSIGIQLFDNNKWAAGVDFSAMNWKQYRSFGAIDSVANSTFKIAIGGEYTPNANSMYKYLSRITYRLGFYYGRNYIQLRNTPLDYYAITLGGSIPFKRSMNHVHLGLEIGKMGTEAKGLIRENFVKFSVGFSLNDRWFIKRKYD